MTDTLREVVEKGVKQNADRIALGKDPIKPFFMVGRMGDQEVVVRQDGTSVVMNVGLQEVEKVNLSGDDHEKEETGHEGGRGGSAGEGQGPGGAPGAVGREV